MTETQYLGIPPGLIDAVLHLVSTGPVPLGGYTLAEMVAVDAVVDFLDEMPSEEEVGEAVRSLEAIWASLWSFSNALTQLSMHALPAPSLGSHGVRCCSRSLTGSPSKCSLTRSAYTNFRSGTSTTRFAVCGFGSRTGTRSAALPTPTKCSLPPNRVR
jgi:hypothetical protein